MAYTVPRVEITQQFLAAPLFTASPLAAFIFGPNYNIFSADVPEDRAWTAAGSYVVAGMASPAPYPRLVAYPEEQVDVSRDTDGDLLSLSARLEGAHAAYFPKTAPSPVTGLPVGTAANMQAVSTGIINGFFPRQLRSAGDALYLFTASNPVTGEVFPRSPFFSNRDVRAGDWVLVEGLAADGTTALKIFTRVQSLSLSPDTHRPTVLETADQLFAAFGATSAVLFAPEDTATTPLKISLYLAGDFDMPSDFFVPAATTDREFKAVAAATIWDPLLLVAATGKPAKLPVEAAAPVPAPKLLLSYRTLRKDNAASIQSISDISQVEERLGMVTPQNPLAQGVYDCLLNAGNTAVHYMAVPTDDAEGYASVLSQARGSRAVYGLVPLTFDPSVHALVKAHVNAMSEPASARWRKGWLCLRPPVTAVLPGFTEAAAGDPWEILSQTADPSAPADLNLRAVAVASGIGVDPDFLQAGVRPGDWLRVFKVATPTGESTDFEIAAVNSPTALSVRAVAAGVPVGMAIQIVRQYSQDERVDYLVAANGDSRRINQVFPYLTRNAGVEKEGFFLAAALAGLRAGSLPHQPLTNAEVLGFDDLTLSSVTYNDIQLDQLASAGVWIVRQDVVGGVSYVRHQLTSAGYDDVGDDPKFSEDSLTTNVDSISYSLQRSLEPFIGRYNVNPATVALVTATVTRQMHMHMTESSSASAGPQLLGFNIVRIGQSELFRDRIEAVVELELPFPLNRVQITLLVP